MKKRNLFFLIFSGFIHLYLPAQCPPLEPIDGLAQPAICNPGAWAVITHTYTIPNGAPANLTWSISPAGSGIFNGPSIGASVVVNWQVTGPAQLCATPTNPCYDPTPVCIDVVVQPIPYVDDPPDVTVCHGDQVFHHFTGTGWTYQWGNQLFGNQYCNSGAPPQGYGDIDFTAVNTGNAPVTCIMGVTPHQDSCFGYLQNWTVTVLPQPSINQPPDVSVCGGAAVAVNFSGNNATSFGWTSDNPAIGLPASGNGNINYVSPKVPQTQTANITVTPFYTSSNTSCPGEPAVFTITLDGSYVDDPPDLTVCPGDPVNVLFSGNADSYDWANNNVLVGLDASGTGGINFIATGSALQQTATVTVTPRPCPFKSETFTITVGPEAVFNPPPDLTVCPGEPVSLVFSGSPGAVFNWQNNNPAIGLGASGNGPLLAFTAANVSGPQTATITVTPSKSGCTGQPQSFTITVDRCCVTSPGTLDTVVLSICGPQAISLGYDTAHTLEPGDSLRFILYTDSLNPMGSIVQYSDSLRFPFLPGLMHFDSSYFAAVIAGPLLSNDSAALIFR